MSLILRKINAFAKKVASLPPKPGGTMPVAELQAQFDAAPEELRAALNGAIDDIIADYATKAELSGIQLGQITDGTVTPAKLSFDPATQAELDTHTGATTAHGAVSAPTPNTLSIRDANGRSQFASPAAAADAATKGYVDGSMLTGSYTGNGVTRTIVVGFTPRFVNIVGPRLSGSTGAVDFSLTPTRGVTSSGDQLLPNTHCVANGFQLGDSTYANGSGLFYEWTAWR